MFGLVLSWKKNWIKSHNQPSVSIESSFSLEIWITNVSKSYAGFSIILVRRALKVREYPNFVWLAFLQNSRNLLVYLCEFCVARVSDLIISDTDRYFSHMPTVRGCKSKNGKHSHGWQIFGKDHFQFLPMKTKNSGRDWKWKKVLNFFVKFKQAILNFQQRLRSVVTLNSIKLPFPSIRNCFGLSQKLKGNWTQTKGSQIRSDLIFRSAWSIKIINNWYSRECKSQFVCLLDMRNGLKSPKAIIYVIHTCE